MSWEERHVSDQQQQNVRGRWRLSRQHNILRAIVLLLLGCSLTLSIAGSGVIPVVYGAPRLQANGQGAGTLAIVGASGANLYNAPGGESTQQLAPGTVLTAVGRTADNLWVVVHDDGNLAGWVEVNEVVLFGIEQLPVMVEGTVPVAEATTATQPQAAPQTPVSLPTPTATPLPTATPTPSPIPTATPTPLPTDTPTPVPTVPPPTVGSAASGESSLVAVVRGGGASLYDRPGGNATEELPTGTALTAWGRSADGQWLVVVASSGAAGWVQLADVVVFNTEVLPVLDSTTGLPSEADTAASSEAQAIPEQPAATPAAQEETAPSGQNATAESTAAPDPNQITASVTVTDSNLNIRRGPGTNFAIVDKAGPGDSFAVSGRNVDATWIELILPELEEGYGWVAADFVTLNRQILSVPVSPRADQPEAVATLAPAATPAPAVAPTLASDPVVATNNPSSNEISSAPTDLSGRLVFQSSNGGNIYVYDLASGSIALLTGGFDPSVSPDGGTVAFTRFGGDHGLYLIDIDGKNERMIWNGGEGLRGPTWSPDGNWIAFVRQSGAFKCRDVGFGICLPDNPFLGDFPLTSVPEFNLSRVDTNGQNFRDIAALNTAQAPHWQRDGIVYQATTGLEITADLPDAQTKALVQAPYYQDPAWQPNGNRVLFQAREGSHWEIFTINSDGSGVAALTRPATALVENLPSNVAPAWSPDGQWIVFLSNRDEENDAGEWRLWVMNADGSNQHPLPIDVPLEYSFTNEQVVSWGVAN